MKIKVLFFTEHSKCAEFISQFLQFEQTVISNFCPTQPAFPMSHTGVPYNEDIYVFICGIFEFYSLPVPIFLDKYTFSDLKKISSDFYIHIRTDENEIQIRSFCSILSGSIPENSRYQIKSLPFEYTEYLKIKHKLFHKLEEIAVIPGRLKRSFDRMFVEKLFEDNERKKIQTASIIVEIIQKNTVFQNFQYISSPPNIPPVLSTVQMPYLERLVTNLLNFLESTCVHKFGILWSSKNYGRYVHKTIHVSLLEPSYLFFIKHSDPSFVFCLLKSNTHINDSHIDHWFAGSVKQVKVRALLFKFKICDSIFCHKIENDNIVITPVVTFTRPKEGFLSLSDMSKVDSPQGRILLKTSAMHTLLGTDRFQTDFSDWEILHFEDVRHRASRLIAFQKYLGSSLFDNQRFFACSPIVRLKAIFTLLEHFNEIVFSQRLWPRDVKLENICALETAPNVYELSFIDFKSPTMITNTLLRDERAGHARASNYLHPIHKISRYSMTDLRLITALIDSRPAVTESGFPRQGWPKSERFKLIGIHVCFELCFLIFQLLHCDRFTRQNFDIFTKMFNASKKFPKVHEFEHDLLKIIRLDIQPSQPIFERLYELPMYKTLKMFIYGQDFFNNQNLLVSHIIELFFYSVRTDFLNYLRLLQNKVPEQDKALFLALNESLRSTENDYHTLSTSWSVRLAKKFEQIPNTPKPSDNIVINQLMMV